MKSYLKNAELVSVAPPNSREGELVKGLARMRELRGADAAEPDQKPAK